MNIHKIINVINTIKALKANENISINNAYKITIIDDHKPIDNIQNHLLIAFKHKAIVTKNK